MNAVVGVTDILLDTVGLSDEQTGYIEVIRTSGQHLLTVCTYYFCVVLEGGKKFCGSNIRLFSPQMIGHK